MATTHPRFVRWAIVLGIVIVLNIFFIVIRSLALPAPDFTTYCPTPTVNALDAQSCDASGGIWTANVPAPTPDQTNPKASLGYCDYYAKCQPVFQSAMDQYNMYAFTLLLILGIISVVVGIVPLGSSIVSSGLSYGGVVTFIIASAMYWSDAGNWIRLLISAIALAALLYIGWKRFRD